MVGTLPMKKCSMFKIKLTNLYDIYDSCYMYSEENKTTYLLCYIEMTSNKGAKYLAYRKYPKRGWMEVGHIYNDKIYDYLTRGIWKQVDYPKEYDQGETEGEGAA